MSSGLEFAILERFGVAILLAALVGLERERQTIKYGVKTFGGIRTFPLIGLFGALSSYLLIYSEILVGVLVFALSAFMVVSYFLSSKMTKSVGLTSEIAAVLVFIVGFIASEGHYFLATALTLIVMIFLHMKNPLHLLAEKVNRSELQSTLKFMIIAFIILPLLPNQAYGPLDVFNPYIVWLMVVFISGISFLSYLAVKFIGSKNGLVSSTALALTFSDQSKRNQRIVNPYVFAILVASSAMFFRILVEVSVLNPALLSNLAYPMITMGAIGLFAALFFWMKRDSYPSNIHKDTLEMESPFQLKPALKFGAFFALILLLSKISIRYFGDNGVYLTSFVSGLMDVDAITVSMAQLAKTGLNSSVATLAITIAAITNTFVKAGIFFMFGSKRVAKHITFVFVLMLVLGFAVNFLFSF